MPSLFRLLFLAFLSLPSLALAEFNVLGTVVDGASEHALPRVRILSADSSYLGSSDAEGRFELRLVRALEVTFRREGFRDKVVDLSEITDPLDVQVAMDPLGTSLEGRSVVTRLATSSQRLGTIGELERFGGMRVDLQEHLRNLPGVSGIREFSSEISIYGSRTHDVAHLLGPFQIPNLRHLDYSFPGNQSVVNPRVLDRVSVEHDPIQGPLEQGLASALVYHPLRPATDQYNAVVSVGLANRELDLWGPLGNGTFVASGRWLSPDMMNHLAGRLFVGSRDQTAEQAQKDTNAAPTTEANLQAFDGFLRVEQAMGPMALSATALGSADDHSVKVMSHHNNLENYTRVQQGQKRDLVAFAESQGDLPIGYLDLYGGWVGGSEVIQLSDTILRAVEVTGVSDDPTQPDWAAWTTDRSDARMGFTSRPTWGLMGAETEVLMAYDHISDSRTFGRTFLGGLGSNLADERALFLGRTHSSEAAYERLHGSLRLTKHEKDTLFGASVGGLYTSATEFGPEADLSLRSPAWGIGWTLNASRRQTESVTALGFGALGVHQSSADELKVGAGRRVGLVDVTSSLYWRSMDRPLLPQAQPLWVFPLSDAAKSATALGATLQAKWSTYHPVQVQVNLSRVQGTYELEDGRELDWEANRSFDAWTVVKFHPRADTLFSIILSHSASLGKPSYRYLVDTVHRTLRIEADPQISQHPEYADQFRTDLRMELDIPTNLAPAKMLRFYAEAQNIFGQFSGEWARPLGGDNFRHRSWSPQLWSNSLHRLGPNGTLVSIQPLFARGTDLLLTFGIEGRLGI